MRKTFLALAALILAVLLHTGSVHAQNYPWCAQYSGDLGGQNCGVNAGVRLYQLARAKLHHGLSLAHRRQSLAARMAGLLGRAERSSPVAA
jgi:hypothetical protein